MQFVSKPAFVHLEAPGRKGEMQRWAVEWGSGMQLSTQGLTATTKAGDHVIVIARRAAIPKITPGMKSITRPKDGWKWNGQFN